MSTQQSQTSPEASEAGGATLVAARSATASTGGDEEHALGPGQSLGRYVLLERIGAGGVGVVWSAYDPQLDRRVALKLLRRSADADDEASRRLIREAQTMGRLRHPNVLTVHDVAVLDGRVVLAMEFIEGKTLRRLLAGERPDWRTLLDLFEAAGRGLAAAHAAGLVHRDFKPDNVMIDGEGRVTVMDFGLARPAEATRESSSASAPPAEPRTGDDLTVTGAVMGTPAYMSPEQFAGRPADARSDQFSFCVALYEALYRRRPFAGDTLSQLAFAVLSENPREPGRIPGVPARLGRVLLRGLAREPEARFADMQSLLAELRRDGAARWRRIGLGVGALVLAGSFAWFARPDASPAMPLCGDGADKVAPMRGRIDEVVRGLGRSGAPWAHSVGERVGRGLGEILDRWQAGYADACAATHVRHEQSEQLLDRRMACLDRNLGEIEALTQLLAAADADAEKADAAVAGLSRPERCADLEWLQARVPPPADPETAARVLGIESELSRVQALRLAGRNLEGLELARRVAADATDVGHAPTRAAAAQLLAQLEGADQRHESARQHHLEAASEAVKAGDMRLSAQALVGVVGTMTADPQHHAEAFRWLELAEAVATRDDDIELAVRALSTRGELLREADRAEQALAAYEQALARIDAMGDDPSLHDDFGVSMSGLAHTRQALGDFAGARETYEQLLRHDLRVVGPDHPETAETHNNLGAMASLAGDFPRALEHQREALRIREGVYGSEHPVLFSTVVNLAQALVALGRFEEAVTQGERAFALAQRHHGPDSAYVAAAEDVLGVVEMRRGRAEAAYEHYARALAIREQADPDHHLTHTLRYNLGETLEALGRLDEALALHRAAQAGLERRLGADHPYVAYPLAGIGRTLTALGRPGEGLASLEAAVERMHAGGDPVDLATTRLWLARARVARHDREGALESARAALAGLEPAGGDTSDVRAQVEQFLREHGP